MKTIQSIDKAMMVLEHIAQQNGKNTLTDMSIALKMKITTLYGIIATLEQWNLIEKNGETNRYALGGKLFQLGKRFEADLSIQTRLRPYLEALAASFGETVHLAMPSGGRLLYIDRLESAHPVRISSSVGTIEKLTATGVGLVLLAYMPEVEWRPLVRAEGVAPDDLAPKLKEIRRDGFLVHSRSHCDCYCLSICIDRLYPTLVGINMVIPAYRFSEELKEKGVQALLQTKQQISQDFHRPVQS